MSEETARPVRVWCTDLSFGACALNEHILSLMPPYVLDPETPELLFYESFGEDHKRYSCPRIFISGENERAYFTYADYAIGMDYMEFGDRYLRVPLWAYYKPALSLLAARRPVSAADLAGREFCMTIVSNGIYADPIRDRFFLALHARRPVASLGRHLRNDDRLDQAQPGQHNQPKLALQGKFLFSLAFENSSSPGYVTEKLMEAAALGTIPIYWGDPLVARDFNPEAFVNRMDFADDEACIDYILALAEDPERMAQMLNAPLFRDPGLPAAYDEKLREFLARIVAQPAESRGRQVLYGRRKVVEDEKKAAERHRFKERFPGLRWSLVKLLERKPHGKG